MSGNKVIGLESCSDRMNNAQNYRRSPIRTTGDDLSECGIITSDLQEKEAGMRLGDPFP
jgi:hypothetical protein